MPAHYLNRAARYLGRMPEKNMKTRFCALVAVPGRIPPNASEALGANKGQRQAPMGMARNHAHKRAGTDSGLSELEIAEALASAKSNDDFAEALVSVSGMWMPRPWVGPVSDTTRKAIRGGDVLELHAGTASSLEGFRAECGDLPKEARKALRSWAKSALAEAKARDERANRASAAKEAEAERLAEESADGPDEDAGFDLPGFTVSDVPADEETN